MVVVLVVVMMMMMISNILTLWSKFKTKSKKKKIRKESYGKLV